MNRTRKIKIIAPSKNQTGFTLVELMIGLFISSLVMATVGMLYVNQSKIYSKLDDIAGIQQNLRGVLTILPMEIRLAGCDPTESHVAGILGATRTQLQFTRDIRGGVANSNIADGDVTDAEENIAYTLTARDNITNIAVAADNNGDGIVDSGGANWNWGNTTPALGRQTGGAGGFQPLADNIEALEFNYILDDGTTTLTPPALNKIRSVQVSLLARATNPADDYRHANLTYTTASGAVWNPPQDRYRRRLVITTIQCRNMR
ncbi:MAG: PilW family protein [Pseudomonadota bacterium]